VSTIAIALWSWSVSQTRRSKVQGTKGFKSKKRQSKKEKKTKKKKKKKAMEKKKKGKKKKKKKDEELKDPSSKEVPQEEAYENGIAKKIKADVEA
jgi:hypothetical protein